MVPMAKDNQIAVRVNDPTYEAIQEYASNYDLTNAEAVRRMSERVLAGEGYLDGPSKVIPDGGEIREKIEESNKKSDEIQAEVKGLNELLRQVLILLSAIIPIGAMIGFARVGYDPLVYVILLAMLAVMLWRSFRVTGVLQ